MRPGTLIRAGKAEHEMMQSFGERSSREVEHAQTRLMDLVGSLRKARHNRRVWTEFSDALGDTLTATDIPAAVKTAIDRISSFSKSDTSNGSSRSNLIMYTRILLAALGLCSTIEAERAANDELTPEEAYQILLNTTNSVSHLKDLVVIKISQYLSEISIRAEHWPPPNETNPNQLTRLEFWLSNWLLGVDPPPRCAVQLQGYLKQCLHPTINLQGQFCNIHTCHTRLCWQQNVEPSQYCKDHRCQEPVELCLDPRSSTTTPQDKSDNKFCIKHTCPRCYELQLPNCGRRDPKACSIHTCQQPECSEIVERDHRYCRHHVCHFCLKNGMELGKKEMARLPYSNFCSLHGCNSDGCDHQRLNQRTKYCKEHSCRVCLRGLVDPALPGARLCQNHRCQHIDGGDLCEAVRFSQDFCIAHSCRVCCSAPDFEETGKVLGAVEDEPPRNTCGFHRLCSHSFKSGRMCPALAASDEHYCERHIKREMYNSNAVSKPKVLSYPKATRPGFCHGITAKKKPCKCRGSHPDQLDRKWFCKSHKNQDESNVDEDEDDDDEEEAEDSDEGNDEEEEREVLVQFGWHELKCQGQEEYFVELAPVSPHPGYCCGQGRRKKKKSKNESVFCATKSPLPDPKRIWFCDAHKKQQSKLAKPAPIKQMRPCDQISLVPSETTEYFCAIHQHQRVHHINDFDHYDASNDALPIDASDSDAEVDSGDDSDQEPQDALVVHSKKEKESQQKSPETPSEKTQNNANLNLHDDFEGDEQVSGMIHPDELDDDDEEDDQVNENLQRLHEIADMDDPADDVQDSDPSDDENDKAPRNRLRCPQDNTDYLKVISTAKTLAWKMSHSDRLRAVIIIMKGAANEIVKLAGRAEQHVTKAQMDVVGAQARVFKDARVVGATVVGAARRLEAIREAEPFAVIVEEACEVMEPTLMSVLAVRSLCKMELIGDHRQLPAFIQNYWFNLEVSQPSIKMSLFERLITGGTRTGGRRNNNNNNNDLNQGNRGSRVPWSVLDEQWRMRSTISNLTRDHYRDVVSIIDHDRTSTQMIGDRLTDMKIKRKLDLGIHKLRVPGVVPSIFFWNLQDNRESRPEAGLSACNAAEAEAVVALTKWLQLCGVPGSSISIITPYKGQRTKIVKCLGRGPSVGGITVSTVDRYQGDENDIVILSIVKTNPGNRFVALKNRFIVAMSRARIGFFIIGSTDAVSKERQGHTEKLGHWQTLLDHLRSPPTPGNDEEAVHKFGSRGVGPELCICCPRHPQSVKNVISPTDFPVSKNYSAFCKQPCQTKLEPCQHDCGLSCHDPSKTSHTPRCMVLIANSCEDHRETQLACHIVNAYDYLCEQVVQHTRDCNDVIDLPCYQLKAVLSGRLNLPKCTVNKEDFHLSCGHVISKPECSDRREYERNAPKCLVKVHHIRPCDCQVEMTCWQRQEEVERPPPCLKSVNIKRPRCHHILSVVCNVGEAIKKEWEKGDHCSASLSHDNKTVVLSGEHYGPPESSLSVKNKTQDCKVPATFRNSCGHEVEVPCYLAFKYASGATSPPNCNFLILKNLPCGHSLMAPCYKPLDELVCHALVDDIYQFKCGREDHIVDAKTCATLKKYEREAPPCRKQEVYHRFRCGHPVRVPCYKSQSITRSVEMGKRLISTDLYVEQGQDYCIAEDWKDPCQVKVSFKRLCGHVQTNVSCYKAFDWAGSVAPPPCRKLVSCEIPLCGHSLKVECWAVTAIKNWNPWDLHERGQKMTGAVDPMSGASVSLLVVKENHKPSSLHPPKVPIKMLECHEQVYIIRSCEHESITRCSNVWTKAGGECVERVTTKCTRCKQSKVRRCSDVQSGDAANVQCDTQISEPCVVCKVNHVTFPCFQLRGECHSTVTVVLECKHQVKWTCGRDSDPREAKQPLGCRKCVLDLWEKQLKEYTVLLKSGLDQMEKRVDHSFRNVLDNILPRDMQIKHRKPIEVKKNHPSKHLDTRYTILRIFYEAMRAEHSKIEPLLPPPFITNTNNCQNYDLVFRSVSGGGSNNNDPTYLFTTPTATDYGVGVELHPFTQENLIKFANEMAPNKTEVQVLLGAIFRHRVLVDVDPFRPENNKSDKAKKMANKTRADCITHGYDCVDPKQSGERQQKPTRRVYWHENAVFPLLTVTIELKQECSICFDTFLLKDIICCEGNKHHSLCETCFCGLAKEAASADGSRQNVTDNGRLKCPSCKELLPQKALSEKMTQAMINVYLASYERRELPNAIAAEREKILAEVRLVYDAKNSYERSAQMIRLDIVDQILTLRCPRCRTAFVDFTGCFALTCQCTAAFCAWCLTDCGRDAHPHVAQCPQGRGRGYYGTFEQFNEHHRQRKQDQVRERLLREPDQEVRRIALNFLRKDLQDLGINVHL
eukprot:TRINITY_DN687_c0_g1_i1.p1 TRINITY_DN687_c0_g1~~TRINITY_DN687_c0_g1_i1.p1  ORF type:complete len:2369 (-),score=253.94 TRINITY_DN687_c0_g1_i1:25-7131(-)